MTNSITAAQSILLAASDLATAGKSLFTEWDLSVAAWQRDRNRFGLRGYEESHPDHKRVMTEIMGQAKKDNAVRRGWIEKAGTNRYKITSLGLAEAQRISNLLDGNQGRAESRSPRHIYETIEPIISHSVFLDYCKDPSEPKTWLGAAAFLSLKRNTGPALDDRLRIVKTAIDQARNWMTEENADTIQRGPVGGGRTIRKADIEKLDEFLRVIQDRFAVQMAAVRRRN